MDNSNDTYLDLSLPLMKGNTCANPYECDGLQARHPFDVCNTLQRPGKRSAGVFDTFVSINSYMPTRG
eukprot:gene917-543_t